MAKVLMAIVVICSPSTELRAQPPVLDSACNCAQAGIGEAFCTSAQVFEGVVLAADTAFVKSVMAAGTWNAIERVDVLFKVQRAWKGPAGTVVVSTSDINDGCAFEFALGKAYLVFATASDGRLVTDRCSPTRELAFVGDGLRESLEFVRNSFDWESAKGRSTPCR